MVITQVSETVNSRQESWEKLIDVDPEFYLTTFPTLHLGNA